NPDTKFSAGSLGWVSGRTALGRVRLWSREAHCLRFPRFGRFRRQGVRKRLNPERSWTLSASEPLGTGSPGAPLRAEGEVAFTVGARGPKATGPVCHES